MTKHPVPLVPYSRSKSTRQAMLKVVSVLAIAWLLLPTRGESQNLSSGQGNLRVMTYNLFGGTSYREALTATSFPELLGAVANTLNEVTASKPADRAAAVAREIAKAQPDLVSLQEATRWITCSTNDFQTCASVPVVQFDQLQSLQAALDQMGQHYGVVVSTTTFTLAAPSAAGQIVQVTDRLAILARTDINASQLQLTNVQTANYAATFTPSVAGIPFPVHRAWASVDVAFHLRKFRFVVTHLESAHPLFTDAQAQELLAGPANTALPVVIALDSNMDPENPADPTSGTYQRFLAAGFADSWTTANPNQQGNTWGEYATQPTTAFLATVRNDQIFVRGGFEPKAAELFGAKADSRTASGLWPSDHLGLAARLALSSDQLGN